MVCVTRFCASLLVVAAVVPLAAQRAPDAERLLTRRYVDGARLRYRMNTRDNADISTVTIAATTRRTADGHFVEDLAWSDLFFNGAPRTLTASSQAFRVAVNLEGGAPFGPLELSKVPNLIGPVTDMLTFYADLFLAMHQGALHAPGDHFYFANPSPSSWADGTVFTLAEDHIDFDITMTAVDARAGAAALVIKHVPPSAPKVRLPADWMRAPVAGTANNWVQVRKTTDGFAASVGRETFDVRLQVATSDGRILAASMDNPVTRITRDCSDAALTHCGDARPSPVMRHVDISLMP